MNFRSPPRRVAITGMGCVTPIGIGREAFWISLENGSCGVRRIEDFDVSRSPVKIAAYVQDFDWEAQLDPKDRKHVARTVPLALAAAREALADANIRPEELSLDEKRAFGVEIGTGGGGLAFTEKQYSYWYIGPETQASVYVIPSSTHGGLSSELSMAFGLRGLSHVVSTGCTSSTDAIFYAAQHIAMGRQDFMIAGGVDAPLAPGILAGFNVMTVLTNQWNDEPHRASRPFSKDRSGMVVGEGSWMYILEDLENAKNRGARVYAEITGYASTCDAYHRVRLEDTGVEPARAMSLALNDAGKQPSEIDYVNLHGTSTVLNDKIETNAVKIALGDHAYNIPMSATKSQVGHPQGASGAAGIGAALFALQTGTVAPTINLDEPDPQCDLDYVPNRSRTADVKVALCNCIGFGSKNSALVLEKCANEMFENFAKRSYQLERLDTGDYTPSEYRRWQQEMRFIHRFFGEMRALRRTLFRDLKLTRGPVSVLDVGAGSGELLRQLRKWTSDRDTFLAGADLNRDATLSIRSETISTVQCDALTLPFKDNSFDFVFCSLLLHHLRDDAVVQLLKEMSRVAKQRIYAIDLNRQPVAYYLYKTIGRFLLQRFTLEDGALSILRSFRPGELLRIAEEAGLYDVKVEHSRLNRLILSGR